MKQAVNGQQRQLRLCVVAKLGGLPLRRRPRDRDVAQVAVRTGEGENVGRVLDELNLERPPGRLEVGKSMHRQSDDLSESWVQNYLEDVSRR